MARLTHDAEADRRTGGNVELEEMVSACPAAAVYVSAFPDFGEFRKHMKAIAWEKEVWLSDAPDQMIHYNDDRFLGPRRERE